MPNEMEKFSSGELDLYRNYLKELINLRGFSIYYYSLEKDKTMASAGGENFYGEAEKQENHYYTRYEIKAFVEKYDLQREKYFNKFGSIENKFGDSAQPERTIVFYGHTPRELWRSDFGNNTIVDNRYEDSAGYLPVQVKLGDIVNYPTGSAGFFKITSFYDFGWGNFLSYRSHVVQLPAIYDEEDLGQIEVYSVDDPNI